MISDKIRSLFENACYLGNLSEAIKTSIPAAWHPHYSLDLTHYVDKKCITPWRCLAHRNRRIRHFLNRRHVDKMTSFVGARLMADRPGGAWSDTYSPTECAMGLAACGTTVGGRRQPGHIPGQPATREVGKGSSLAAWWARAERRRTGRLPKTYCQVRSPWQRRKAIESLVSVAVVPTAAVSMAFVFPDCSV